MPVIHFVETVRHMSVPTDKVETVHEAAELLFKRIVGLDREVMFVISINTQFKVIHIEEVSKGDEKMTIAHCRLAALSVMNSGATMFALAHNHPSGNAQPSGPDIAMTGKIKTALELFDVPMIGSLVLSPFGEWHEIVSKKDGKVREDYVNEIRADLKMRAEVAAGIIKKEEVAETEMEEEVNEEPLDDMF